MGPLVMSADDNKLPIIISTSSNKLSTPVSEAQETPRKLLKSNSTSSGIEMIKNLQNLDIVLRHSNATPTLGHRGLGYACFFCPKQFSNPADLKRHTLDCHDDLKRDPSLPQLKLDNYSVKMDITDLTCNICFKSYDQLADLIFHLRVDHDQPIYVNVKDYFLPFRFENDRIKCAVCDTEFTAFRMLLEHMNKHYRNHICDVCNAGFVTRVSLRTHKKSHEDGDYPCDQCHKVYNSMNKLNMHIRCVHLGQDKRHKCAYCGEKFSSLIMKNNHQVKAHGVAPTTAKCKACDKTFRSYQSLRAHYKTYHLLIKKYKCSDCDMAFPTSGDLREHTVKHTGARDYKCNVCHKAYGRKFTLVQHMRIHNNDRRHKCDYCTMAFVQKCTLKSHLYSKHGIGIKKRQKNIN